MLSAAEKRHRSGGARQGAADGAGLSPWRWSAVAVIHLAKHCARAIEGHRRLGLRTARRDYCHGYARGHRRNLDASER